MTKGEVSAMGRMRFSRIGFHTDVGSRHGRVIALGVMAEIQVHNVHGLGLIARSALTDVEADRIGGIIRERIRAPFDFLQEDFTWAWGNAAPGDCLDLLAERHKLALRFHTPIERRISLRLDADAIRSAERKLCEARDKEFEIFNAMSQLPEIGGLERFRRAA